VTIALFRDLAAHFLVPSGIIALFLFFVVVLLPFQRARTWACRIAVAASVLYLVFGNGFVAHLILGPLERSYKPVIDVSAIGKIDIIVILTGYAVPLRTIAPASWVNESSAYRVLEARWLGNRFPNARFFIAGSRTSAAAMKELMISIGYAPEEISLGGNSVDTELSAADFSHVLTDESCALVTSAGHMPRAIRAFKLAGVDCVPVPTEFYTPFPLTWTDLFPSPEKLRLSDLAVHEYLGILWFQVSAPV